MKLNNNRISLLIIFLLISFFSFAQKNVEFKEENFDNEDAYYDAYDELLDGNDNYAEELYILALKQFLIAQDFNPNNAQLNYKIGVCYLHTNKKYESLKYLKKANQLDPTGIEDIDYSFGQAYQFVLKFDDAIKYYNKYLSKATIDAKRKNEVLKKIEECKNGNYLTMHPVAGMVINLKDINTEYPEYSPMLTADQEKIFFTSRRKGTTGGKKDAFDMMYYEDIYMATKYDNIWGPAKQIKGNVNTNKHDANVGLSNDGQTLYIYRSDKNNGDLYESKLDGDVWGTPKALPTPINSKYRETCMSLSPDKNIIYFISDRKGSFGGQDIFYCEKQDDGTWGEAKNIGDSINTKYNEDGVFIHPDGKTLYFSSQGHNTMGGFDIFKSVKHADGTWGKAENIGYPINTAENDLSIVVSADGQTGYYTSTKSDGYGNKDIYKISFSETDEKNKEAKLTLVKGVIVDKNTRIPIEANIEITDNEKQEKIAVFKSNKKTGEFLISLPVGKNYALTILKEGYLFYSENFDLVDSLDFQLINLDISLSDVEVNSTVVLRNIFFDYGKTILKENSILELSRVIKLLEKHPEMKLEIAGHTDNISSYKFNLKLSQKRAKAVADYLITKGIEKNRLITKGYSYKKPIADNKTEEGRTKNRRVEFKILGY